MANNEPTPQPQPPAYRVIQKGRVGNIDVSETGVRVQFPRARQPVEPRSVTHEAREPHR